MKKTGLAILAFSGAMVMFAGATQAVNGIPVPVRKPVVEDIVKAYFGPHPFPQRKPTAQPASTDVKKERQSQKSAASSAQPALVKMIFEMQRRGEMKQADALLKRLSDESLLGHILYERYMHPTAYRTSFEELKYWLDLYADHPGADKIYKLALARRPADFSGEIKEPVRFKGIRAVRNLAVDKAKRYRSTHGRNAPQRQSYMSLRRQIRSDISNGRPTQALSRLNDHRGLMDKHEFNMFRAEIARGYFYAGVPQKALRTARQAIKGSAEKVPLAYWIGGLTHWKNGRYDKAAIYFKNAASSEYASGWIQAAASYWAARSLMRTGDVREVSGWLEQAHAHPRTFYGLLAMRALGRYNEFNWSVPTFTRQYYKLLNDIPNGRRAMALVEAGQTHLAEAELLNINIDNDSNLQNAMLAYANFANLPRLAYRLGNSLLNDNKQYGLYEAALYPKSDWVPSDGYRIDPALIHALIHQESKFDPRAKNPSGASGLMQIMPATARYTAKKYGYGLSHESQLLDPQINLDIGQLYLIHLLKNPLVEGNVIKLLVAYNAGPGNLKRWWDEIEHGDDPLLFIEMIPVAETRAYIERVLSNYWMYRMQNNEPLKSLDSLAEGRWAFYKQNDELYDPETYKVAVNR